MQLTLAAGASSLCPARRKKSLRSGIDRMTMNNGSRRSCFEKLSEDGTMILFSNRKIPIALGGVKLSIEQRLALDEGKTILICGMVAHDKQVYDCYVKYSDEKQGGGLYRNNPDETASRRRMQQQHKKKRG